MSAHYSDDHVGRFVVVSTHDTETIMTGVTRFSADQAMRDLAARRSPTVDTASGRRYLVDGLHFIAAYWEPSS